MKNQILFLVVSLISFNCFSQILFEKGYYIDNTDNKINCLIKNMDWKKNPTDFEYKATENSEPLTIDINSVKEFGIYNISKFIRQNINIDRSSYSLVEISKNKQPEFVEELLFLKVLIEGNASLYSFSDSELTRYFYNLENEKIEQLVYKNYKNDNGISENNHFRQQLYNSLNCSSISIEKLNKLEYKKHELLNLFEEFNNCKNSEFVNFDSKIQNNDDSNLNSDFGSKITFGIGVEVEYILPFNKNKWALSLEPTYQSFKTETSKESSTTSGGILKSVVNYNSIELPLTLRHYFYLNEDTKLFANATYIHNLSGNSTIEFKRADDSTVNTLDISAAGNVAIGFGAKMNDKYSVELRYGFKRNLLNRYVFWTSDFNTISLIFGYSLF